ncbi:MAG TPA: GNAT family N-acetyltransferase [Alphaproteobacteria bacterium]|nr:GNAT family N-acetyltransferase [Alphaproteobacteria bacterium]
MFELLSEHFDGVTRPQFQRDLAEKNWVILLERDGRLVGFSTLLAYEKSFGGEPVSVIYSGDTIVAPEAWNSPALSRAWIACVRELRRSHPRGRYYWLLLTSGFRTYRFLPVFWRTFYPRFDAPMPPEQKALLDFLANDRFGAQYDPRNGIVRFTQPQRLRNDTNVFPTGKAADLHVSFFLQRNPGHITGDELVCLTELTDENLTPAGRRMVEPRTNEPGRADLPVRERPGRADLPVRQGVGALNPG